MSLVELQNLVKPLTLPDMLALEAKGHQDAVDKTKIFYERVFQQRIMTLLTRLIERRGSDTVFGCDINCAYAFHNTRVPDTKENPKYTKEICQGFVTYVGERLKTVFPDYDVKTELKVEPGFFTSKYTLEAVLIRKEPHRPLPPPVPERGITRGPSRAPTPTKKAIEPFVLQHKAYK